MNYGCWCSYAFNPTVNNLPLKYPIDSFDFVCKSYHDCRSSTFKPGTNDYSCADYSRPLADLFFDLEDDFCMADSSCAESLCQCQLDFVKDLKKVVGMGKEFRSDSTCITNVLSDSVDKDGFCKVKSGSGHDWKAFNSDSHICIGEEK